MNRRSKWNRPVLLTAIVLGGFVTTLYLYSESKKKNLKKNSHVKIESLSQIEADQNNSEGEKEIEALSTHVREPISNTDLLLNKKNRRIKSDKDVVTDTPNPIIPGTQRIYVRTFGCSHNNSDSETMMGLLKDYGYSIADTLEEGDLCVVNSCTVKNPSQEAMASLIKKAQIQDKKVVVTGCVPQSDNKLDILQNVSLLGVTQLNRIVETVEQTLKGHRVELLTKAELPSLDLPKLRKNRFIEIIPISGGCLGSCTFCKTKYARGDLSSYEISAIVNRIESSIKDGVKQIWLTSEDLGAYGLDIGTDIIQLLQECTGFLEKYEKSTNERIMLRLGMTNPPYMLIHNEKIVKILNHRNVFKFLHIPVQSGSTQVLNKMNREYQIEDFKFLVDTVLNNVPRVTIATDIICGFPTETDEDHKETINLLDKYKFPVVNISQFYSRPGTPASKYPKVKSQIVKKRSQEMSALFRSYKCTDFFLNSYQRVWFTEIERNQLVGHTIHYIKCTIPIDESLLGQSDWVYITEVTKWHIVGYLKQPPCDNFNSIDELYIQ